MQIKLKAGAWYGDFNLSVKVPVNSEIKYLNPADSLALNANEVKQLVISHIKSETFNKKLVGKSVCIVIDDITRPTPVKYVLEILLTEIEKKYNRKNICILIATGAHKPMSPEEIELKIGNEIVKKIRIVNHNFVGNDLVYCGEHQGGPLYLNKNFVEADVRITLGGILPHNETGFGGGAKLIVPGIAGAETISFFHGALHSRKVGNFNAAKSIDKRTWCEKVAQKTGVSYSFILIINSKREIAGIEGGDIVEAHKKASQKCYNTGITKVSKHDIENADVCVVNCYPLDSDPVQMGKALLTAKKIFKGKIVVINNASDGIFYHGMGMGCGINKNRLLKNISRIFKRQFFKQYVKTVFKLIFSPKLFLRYTYFFFNVLPFTSFKAPKPVNNLIENEKLTSDLILFSENYPLGGLLQKHPKAQLIQTKEKLEKYFAENYTNSKIVVLPVAPIQVIKSTVF